MAEQTASKLPDYITENPDHSLTVRLERGVTIHGTFRETLTMREWSVADQRAVKKMDFDEGELHLIANLAEIAPEDLNPLAMRDYDRLQVALGFSRGLPPTTSDAAP